MESGEGVAGWIRGVIELLRRLEEPVRRDEPDAVHKARTTTRRLRAILPLVPGGAAKAAQKRLRKYGRVLGAARDLEVRAALAEKLIDELGGTRPTDAAHTDSLHTDSLHTDSSHTDASGTDAARERLVRPARREYAKAHEDVVAFLDGTGYAKLLKELDEVAEAAASVDELAVLHEARKAARSLRYLAEAYGDREKAELGARLQDELGDHRDHTLLANALEGEDDPVLSRLRENARARAAGLVSRDGR